MSDPLVTFTSSFFVPPLPPPFPCINAAFLPLSSLSMASQWEWECNYAVRRCLQTQKRLNLFQQLAVIPQFNLQLLHPVGKREKQIVRTRGRETEHMDVILQNTVGYNFYKARAHIKAITGDFTAHLGCAFSNLRRGLDCCHSGGNANKRFSWLCYWQLQAVCSVTVCNHYALSLSGRQTAILVSSVYTACKTWRETWFSLS